MSTLTAGGCFNFGQIFEQLVAALRGDGTMSVITLTNNPTVTATGGAQGQLASYSGGLYVHLDASASTNWLNLTALLSLVGYTDSDPFVYMEVLSADPRVTPADGSLGEVGTWGGKVFIHVTGDADTSWVDVSALWGRTFTVTANPTATPPATNYPIGSVLYWANGGSPLYFLKMGTDNVALSDTVRASYVELGALRALMNDLAKVASLAFTASGPLHPLIAPTYAASQVGGYQRFTTRASFSVAGGSFSGTGGSKHISFSGYLPAGAFIVAARALLIVPFAGTGGVVGITAKLGKVTGGANDGHLVSTFDLKGGAAGAQATVGTGDPMAISATDVSLTVTVTGTSHDISDMTDGSVAIQLDYIL